MSRIKTDDWITNSIKNLNKTSADRRAQLIQISSALDTLFLRSSAHFESLRNLERQVELLKAQNAEFASENIKLKSDVKTLTNLVLKYIEKFEKLNN